jgi:hypothetical protein
MMVQSVGDRLMCKINSLNYDHGCNVSHVLYVCLLIYKTKCSSACKHEWTQIITCKVTRNFKRHVLNCSCCIQFYKFVSEMSCESVLPNLRFVFRNEFSCVTNLCCRCFEIISFRSQNVQGWYFVIPPDWLKG